MAHTHTYFDRFHVFFQLGQKFWIRKAPSYATAVSCFGICKWFPFIVSLSSLNFPSCSGVCQFWLMPYSKSTRDCQASAHTLISLPIETAITARKQPPIPSTLTDQGNRQPLSPYVLQTPSTTSKHHPHGALTTKVDITNRTCSNAFYCKVLILLSAPQVTAAHHAEASLFSLYEMPKWDDISMGNPTILKTTYLETE